MDADYPPLSSVRKRPSDSDSRGRGQRNPREPRDSGREPRYRDNLRNRENNRDSRNSEARFFRDMERDFTRPIERSSAYLSFEKNINKFQTGELLLQGYVDDFAAEYVPNLGDRFVMQIQGEFRKDYRHVIRISEDYIYLFPPSMPHTVQEVNLNRGSLFVLHTPQLIFPHSSVEGVFLPKPGEEAEKYAIIFGLPTGLKFATDHRNACFCIDSDMSYQDISRNPVFCQKKECEMDQTAYSLLPDGHPVATYNPTRIYSRPNPSERNNCKVLVPMPFTINLAWPRIAFQPLLSGSNIEEPLIRYFYSFAEDGRFARQLSKMYEVSPQHWQPRNHPLFRNPPRGTELYELSKGLYGCEMLPRIMLCAHPASLKDFILASTMEDDLKMKQVKLEYPGDLEKNSLFANIEWLKQEENSENSVKLSKVACPQCPPVFSHSGQVRIIDRYSKLEYISHYEGNHYGDLALTGSCSEIGTNQRILEGFTLYLSALAVEGSKNPQMLITNSLFSLSWFTKVQENLLPAAGKPLDSPFNSVSKTAKTELEKWRRLKTGEPLEEPKQVVKTNPTSSSSTAAPSASTSEVMEIETPKQQRDPRKKNEKIQFVNTNKKVVAGCQIIFRHENSNAIFIQQKIQLNSMPKQIDYSFLQYQRIPQISQVSLKGDNTELVISQVAENATLRKNEKFQ